MKKAERRRRVVDGEHGERQVVVPVVLASVGEGAQRVTDDAVGPLHLSVGVLVVRRADDEARAPALDEGPKHLARELGVVVHHEYVGEAVAGTEAHVANDRCRVRRRRRRASGDRVHLAGQEVDVVLDHVETSRRRWQPGDPIHPDHPAASRWQRQGV
jgi:hypothetical protein